MYYFVFYIELSIRDILGKGTSGIVDKIKNIESDSKKSINDKRELMSERCLHNGSCWFAMKVLLNDDNLSKKESARGRIYFTVEVK